MLSALLVTVSALSLPVSPPRRASRVSGIAMAQPAITVLGGTGFVGSRVCKLLVDGGALVTSVSKGGRVPKWCEGEAWTESVTWVSNDLCRGPREALEAAIGTPAAVVSCVGSVGFDLHGLRLGNGIANVEAAKAAKKAGTSRYIYVSVASEVAQSSGWLPSFFAGYFDGKKMAQNAMVDAVGEGNTCFVKPSFIYGGDKFGLFPPRVTYGYGSGVEELLSAPLLQKVADLLPGLLKVALRPPVSVDAVAGACAAAALGSTDADVIEGNVAINAAAGVPAATGLSDFAARVAAKLRSEN